MPNYHFRMGVKGLMKFKKSDLINFIIKWELKKLPKKRLAILYYELMKRRLPQLRQLKPRAQLDIKEYRKEVMKPKRKTKRRASPKQIAWRKKFAKMSKAGTLRKRRC